MQLADGQIPDLVPGDIYPADSNWGTALSTITWQLYRHYGDSKILEEYYNPIVAYVRYLQSVYNSTGLSNFPYRWGDWLPPWPQPQTNKSLISSFGFLHDVYVLINISQVLGKKEEAAIYSALYHQIAEEFHRVFFNTSFNFYADGMQAAQVLALALPTVVPENVRNRVVDHLTTDISQQGNHVTTGIVSTAQIYPVLSDNGHHDLALELISSTTYPSYGYMFTNPYENATTLWEVWNAPIPGPGLNSRNHIMYGSVGAWFYSHLAGIELSSNIITIRPRMASETKKHLMKKLDCQLSTLYGLVHISYTRDERDTVANSILLRVTIPPNARARVMFEPLFVGAECATLIESNNVVWSSDPTTTSHREFNVEQDLVTGLITVYIGSGQYEFQALWK
jgi:alpha-L-rhamnosidase